MLIRDTICKLLVKRKSNTIARRYEKNGREFIERRGEAESGKGDTRDFRIAMVTRSRCKNWVLILFSLFHSLYPLCDFCL